MDDCLVCRVQTRQSSIQRRINTVVYSDDGHASRPKHVVKKKRTKKILHQVGFIYKIVIHILNTTVL